jgi:chromate reductase, NAD(P)H dehydrogenase (quinone)
MDQNIDVAVIVGSFRKASLNRIVANALIELAPVSLKLSIVEIGVVANGNS